MKQVILNVGETSAEFKIRLQDLLEEHFDEPVGIVVKDSLEMKKTNLTRGEILRGLELGYFKEGDKFIKHVDGLIVTVRKGGTLQYDGSSNFMLLEVKTDEVWDVHEKIDVGDWVARQIGDKTVSVCKVQAIGVIDDETRLEVKYAGNVSIWMLRNVRKATEDEIKYSKRSEAFELKGRLFNEYKIGDVLPRKADKENYAKVIGVDNHGVLLCGGGFRGWVDKDSADIPVFFVEDMVEVE